MLNADYVREQLAKVQAGEASPAKVRDYALLCVALEHLEGGAGPGAETVAASGGSEFLEAVAGKDAAAAWAVMDELMTMLRQVRGKVYDSVMRQIRAL